MSLKTRLSKLEKKINRLPDILADIDLTRLTDEELAELQKQLQEESAKLVGREKAEAFSNWIASLPEEELEKLSSNTNYLISETERLGLN